MARTQKAADERGVAVSQLVSTAIEHEIGDEARSPVFADRRVQSRTQRPQRPRKSR
jgi:hypothetical protein